MRNYKIIDYNTIIHDTEHQNKEAKAEKESKPEFLTINVTKENKSSVSIPAQSHRFSRASTKLMEREKQKERNRINKINNNFTHQSLVSKQTEKFNPKIHKKDFDTNFRKEKSVLSNHSSNFLPPINSSSKENLRDKATMLKLESIQHR